MQATAETSGALSRAGTSPAPSARRRIVAIARNTFREAVRDRVLYNLVLFVLLLSVSAIFLGAASASQDAKIIVDLGLSAMLLFGAFIAIFVGVGLVWKEIERRTLYAIFAKPVGRGEFLLGKYLGLCLTLAVNVLVMGAGVTLVLLYVVRGTTPLLAALWPTVGLIYLELTDAHRGRAALLLVLVAGLLGVRLAGRVRHRALHGRPEGPRRAVRRGRRPRPAADALLRAAQPLDLQPDHARGPRPGPPGRLPAGRAGLRRGLGRGPAGGGGAGSSPAGTSSEPPPRPRAGPHGRARLRRQRGDGARARRAPAGAAGRGRRRGAAAGAGDRAPAGARLRRAGRRLVLAERAPVHRAQDPGRGADRPARPGAGRGAGPHQGGRSRRARAPFRDDHHARPALPRRLRVRRRRAARRGPPGRRRAAREGDPRQPGPVVPAPAARLHPLAARRLRGGRRRLPARRPHDDGPVDGAHGRAHGAGRRRSPGRARDVHAHVRAGAGRAGQVVGAQAPHGAAVARRAGGDPPRAERLRRGAGRAARARGPISGPG